LISRSQFALVQAPFEDVTLGSIPSYTRFAHGAIGEIGRYIGPILMKSPRVRCTALVNCRHVKVRRVKNWKCRQIRSFIRL